MVLFGKYDEENDNDHGDDYDENKHCNINGNK